MCFFSEIGIEKEIEFGPRFLEVVRSGGFLLFLCCGR
jgi:hypothetical protein